MRGCTPEKPLISVIVPVYMAEAYLDRCVQSILKQTWDPFELILVDDGSPDHCPDMCDRYAERDSRIRVIHKENGGLSSARNRGIQAAAGEYLHFVDADDWLEPDAIAYLYDLLKKYQADFSMASNIRTDGAAVIRKQRLKETCLSQREFFMKLFKIRTQENVQYAWAKLYKKSLFETIRYPEGMTSEDIPAAFQAAQMSERIACSNKVIYHYFMNPSSITGSGFGETTFDLIKVWDLVCAYAQDSTDEVRRWAGLNRERMNFSILFLMAMDPDYQKHKKKWNREIRQIHEDLRRSLPGLIRAELPVSRKILMIGFSYMAGPFMGLVHIVSAGKRRLSGAAWRK